MVTMMAPHEPVASGAEERPVLAAAATLLREHQGRVCLIDEQGRRVALPETAVRLIHRLVQELAHGNPVEVTTLPKELTIQHAAELLDLRPEDVVRLIDHGELPIVQSGALRRIRFEDVMAYKPRRDAERRAILRRMTQEGQEIEDRLVRYPVTLCRR